MNHHDEMLKFDYGILLSGEVISPFATEKKRTKTFSDRRFYAMGKPLY